MSKMTGLEVIEEYEWLISNGVSPLLACEALGRKPVALARMFWRYDRRDLCSGLDYRRKNVKEEIDVEQF